jgi:hypothetical protein
MKMDTWKHGDMGMKTWKHGEMETRRHGDKKTWKNGDRETWTCRRGHADIKRKTESQVILNPFTVYSSRKWKFVACPFINKETNGTIAFANGQNELNGLIYGFC